MLDKPGVDRKSMEFNSLVLFMHTLKSLRGTGMSKGPKGSFLMLCVAGIMDDKVG